MPGLAVLVDDVRVDYGRESVLNGVALEVEAGTTLAVLGHNGAGKTTLIRALTTLIRPRRGRIVIDGVDALAEPTAVRRRIAVTGQYAGLDEYLTTVENLEFIGRLAGLRRRARPRAAELVDRFDLHLLAGRRVGELSGGSRRRVDLAASLVGSPSVLFLDEPTTGLDPAARVALWDVVDELTDHGTTVLLTTQYLEEADRLADRIAVLGHGRIAAQGSPSELKALIGGKVLHITVPSDRLDLLPLTPDASHPVDARHVRVTLSAVDADTAAALVARLAGGPDGSGLVDLEIASPSLDDVFFHLATQGVPA
jgi:ABC-2 type transport system ATP-binding protein